MGNLNFCDTWVIEKIMIFFFQLVHPQKIVNDEAFPQSK